MSSIGSIKDILSIKIKTRHDSYTDQFVRIFMPKIFIISAVIMSVDFFNDKVSCIMPKGSTLGNDFVHSACWIQGFYIYRDLGEKLSDSSYYGIPQDITHDGVMEDGTLCSMEKRGLQCRKLTKTFYLQFQWMPFYIASLALLHYLPYMLFRIVNTDMISLKTTLKDKDVNTDQIVKNFFNYKINSMSKMRIRVVMNWAIKIVYVAVTVTGFLLTDLLLNGDFRKYGSNWMSWTKHNNSKSHDFNEQGHPKPGNVLLPPMGMCEIHEASQDWRITYINGNRFICEISPHILYQYVLIILWFMMVFAIVISVVGLFMSLLGNLFTITFFLKNDNPAREIYQIVTFRECEYLELIRRTSLLIFGDLVRKLQRNRADMTKISNSFDQPDVESIPQRFPLRPANVQASLRMAGTAPQDPELQPLNQTWIA